MLFCYPCSRFPHYRVIAAIGARPEATFTSEIACLSHARERQKKSVCYKTDALQCILKKIIESVDSKSNRGIN